MINQLRLKFGKAAGSAAETISATPVTVFVGPNNSGKSKVLSEIHRFCVEGTTNANDVILDQLVFANCDPEVAATHLARITLKPHATEALQPGHVVVGKRGHRLNINREKLLAALLDPNARPHQFCSWYLQHHTLILNGQSRINLVNQQAAGDLQQTPQTSFQLLFRDDMRRAEVRRIIHEAFGVHFTIDPTHLGQLRLRLSLRAPSEASEERGIHEAAVRFHAEAMSIHDASDGVKAFTGMITEIIAGDPTVLLIDEPEAFLHPSLAFKLGTEIARTGSSSEKRLFVSTHSPNFVMGCIQSGAPVNIVRLTYRDGVATARVLPNDDILRLMRNPLLRSTGVMSGLFYEFVVVTEADADRAFYQEINERLLRFDPARGIPNCLFINAQNKQTVQTIVRPLRHLGIPAAGIVDIDVLKEGGSVWNAFLESAAIPEIDRNALAATRASVKQRFDATQKDMKRQGGVGLLDGEDREAASNLFDRLAEYGLFVVRHGELESWLSHLGATGHSPAWLISMFEKMGEDAESPAYTKPAEGDVWDFMGQLKSWLTNPNRKGIPT